MQSTRYEAASRTPQSLIREDLTTYRSLFPIAERYAYLNHAASAPLSVPVVEAVQACLDMGLHEPGEHRLEPMLAAELRIRERAARLLNAARPDEVVVVPGTATGINTAARSLPLRMGDNVLVLEGEYPAVIYPWLSLAPQGVMTKTVPAPAGGLDLDLLASRVDPHTRVVCVSTAMYTSGFRNDMAALGAFCRQRDIFLVVDAIQTLGCLPVDVQAWNVDFLACGSQKWLMAPHGTGLLYCRHDLLDRLQVGAYAGAMSVVDPFNYLDINFTLPPTSARFQVGSWNFLGIAGLDAALGLLLDVGTGRIAQQVLALTDLAIQDLIERGFTVVSCREPEHRSGIVVVEVEQPEAVVQHLLAEGVVVAARGRGIRLSPHFYNTEDEVRRVGDLLGAAR